jgi:hypothetical protein
MSRTIEFKNFAQVEDLITVDFYTENRFIMKISDTESNIKDSEDTGVIIYEYFRKAALLYLDDIKHNNFNIH